MAMSQIDVHQSYDCRALLAYLTYTLCKSSAHTPRRPYACVKHGALLYNCKCCELRSRWIPYTYRCTLCSQFFCAVHFIDHIQLLGFCAQANVGINCGSKDVKLHLKSYIGAPTTIFHLIAVNLSATKITVSKLFNKKNPLKNNL